MPDVLIFGKLVRFQNAVTDVAVTNLRDTLAVVPTQHLLQIRQIDVVPPLSLSHNPNYSGGGSGLGYPRLSELCFDRSRKPRNFPLNRTLLHEVGHVLDHIYSCLATLAPEHLASLNAIQISEEAQTHGAGERYAAAYQRVICGTATDTIRAAVLASRAFSGVDLVHP